MFLTQAPKRHRFPVAIISQAVWLNHRFNHSYRDVQEHLAYGEITLSHENVRAWCLKFTRHFTDMIGKRGPCGFALPVLISE